jgi:hypothetical protein
MDTRKGIALALGAVLAVFGLTAVLLVQQGRVADARGTARDERRRADTERSDKRDALSDLEDSEQHLADSQRDADRLRQTVEDLRSETDGLEQDVEAKEALLDELWAVQGLQTDCHNAWSDFSNGYYDRSVAEDRPYIDRAVDICDQAAAAFNALLNRQESAI